MALARSIASKHSVEVLVDPAELQKWTVESRDEVRRATWKRTLGNGRREGLLGSDRHVDVFRKLLQGPIYTYKSRTY